MRQRLASADLSLDELLSGRYVFSIPAYQRDYAWGKDEALQLVDDIAAVLDDGGYEGATTPYFIGTMLFVEQTADAKSDSYLEPKHVDVVDGQQRLITLSIMFAVLRDLAIGDDADALDALLSCPGSPLAELNRERTYQLRLRAADAEYFRATIQAPAQPRATRRTTPGPDVGDNPGSRHIADVRQAILRKFNDEYDAAGRAAFAAFARRHARVLVVSSDDFDYAYQIFLTINDRGKRLSIEDIFRGEILGPLDHDQRRRYEAVVDEMDKYMEDAEKRRSRGKTFFSHLAAISGWQNRGIIASLKRAVQQRGGPRRFAADVFAPMAEAYLLVKGRDQGHALPETISDRLMALRWLEQHGDDDWIAPAMLGIVRLRHDPAALDAFLAALDRFAHALMILGCGRDARRRHYAPILRRMANGEPDVAAEPLFALRPDDQRQLLRNIATRLHRIDPPTARLVLVRADQAVTNRPFAYYQPMLSVERQSPDRFTVEHVCPKGAMADGSWLRLFPDKRRRMLASQCIGNLVLVTEAQNKQVNQDDYLDKKRVLFATDDPYPFHLTEMLRAEDLWDETAIERRYLLIMRTVQAMWALEGAIPRCPAVTLQPALAD